MEKSKEREEKGREKKRETGEVQYKIFGNLENLFLNEMYDCTRGVFILDDLDVLGL